MAADIQEINQVAEIQEGKGRTGSVCEASVEDSVILVYSDEGRALVSKRVLGYRCAWFVRASRRDKP